MGNVKNPEPIGARNACGCGFEAYLILENFTTSTRQTVQTSVFHAGNDLECAQSRDFLESEDFFWAEGINFDTRMVFFQKLEHLEVPFKRQGRIRTALQQNARAADFLEFADLLRDLLEAQGVGSFWRGVR